MRLRILRNVKEMLNNRDACQALVHFIELRQRLFEAQYGKALCLDRYDLIADHILVYEGDTFDRPIAYLRSVTSEKCREFDIPMPLVLSISHSPVHLDAYLDFEKNVPGSVTMGFLCLDQRYKGALAGIKTIDLLTWVAYQTCDARQKGMGFCATSNSKYNQNAWLENMGPIAGGLPSLKHPLIPDPHDLILIPKIRDGYWAEEKLKFGKLLAEAQWLAPEAERPAIAA